MSGSCTAARYHCRGHSIPDSPSQKQSSPAESGQHFSVHEPESRADASPPAFEHFPQTQEFHGFSPLLGGRTSALLALADVIFAGAQPSALLQKRGCGARSAPADGASPAPASPPAPCPHEAIPGSAAYVFVSHTGLTGSINI